MGAARDSTCRLGGLSALAAAAEAERNIGGGVAVVDLQVGTDDRVATCDESVDGVVLVDADSCGARRWEPIDEDDEERPTLVEAAPERDRILKLADV